MSDSSTHHRAAKPKASLYEEITAHIVADMEAGIFPWARPWGAGGGGQAFALPRNAATGKSYSGINVLILWGRLFECSFASSRWLTFRQASSLGGSVRKGEHGVTVCYADRFVPKREQGETGHTPQGGQEAEGAAIPFLRRYTVFNVDQCDNLPDHCLAEAPALPEREIVPQAEALTVATRANIRIGGAKAFYSPSDDAVHVPPQPAFHEQINYYRTLFHELGHWTGHPSRLNRDQLGAFGSKLYANEELIAELTAAFVCAALAIKPTRGNGDAFTAVSLFARLMALPDEAVLRILALVMAETLAAGSILNEAAGLAIKPEVTRWWKLDDVFLDLLKDRTAINALLSEIAGKAVADANVSETGKVQKKIIHDFLNGEGRERAEGFVPRYMTFPIGHYDPNKTLEIARASEDVNALFT